jgi:hypothetical protein
MHEHARAAPCALLGAELAHNGWRGSRQSAVGSGDQNRASVSQDRPRLLAPEPPRQTDDGGAVHDWKQSRLQRLEHGQPLPVSDRRGHEGVGASDPRAAANERVDPHAETHVLVAQDRV